MKYRKHFTYKYGKYVKIYIISELILGTPKNIWGYVISMKIKSKDDEYLIDFIVDHDCDTKEEAEMKRSQAIHKLSETRFINLF